MAGNNLSAQKRTRQNLKRRMINKGLKSSLKTQYKQLIETVKNNEKEEALSCSKKYISLLDNAVKKNVLHKNNANRKKSKAMKLINNIKKVKKEKVKENA